MLGRLPPARHAIQGARRGFVADSEKFRSLACTPLIGVSPSPNAHDPSSQPRKARENMPETPSLSHHMGVRAEKGGGDFDSGQWANKLPWKNTRPRGE